MRELRGALEGTAIGCASGMFASSSVLRASFAGGIISPLLGSCVEVSMLADVGVDCAARLGKREGGGYFWKKRRRRGGKVLAAITCCDVLIVAVLGVCIAT